MLAARVLPFLRWSRGYSRADLTGDLLGGATTAALLIPQAMAYALLAGLPPIVGLYAALAPPVVYALLGTSRRLAVGPVAIDSLLTAAALAPLAAGDPVAYAAAAAALALLVGAMQAVTGALRLGFIVNFLSLPVLRGFTAAAAILIMASQLGPLLGLRLPTSTGIMPTLQALVDQAGTSHLPTVGLGLTVVVMLLVMGRFRGKALLVVVAGVVLGRWLDVDGVALLGAVPSGLPVPAVPVMTADLVVALAPAAAILALISFMEAFSATLVVARRGEVVDPNQELVALGLANAAAGLVRGYPIAGGLSRTAVNAQAGARTPLAGVFTAALVALTLVLLAPLLATLPRAVLSAIIVVAVSALIDVGFVRELWRVKRRELLSFFVTFAATLILGVSLGLAFGVGASLLFFVLRTTRPHTAVLGRLPGTTVYRNVRRFPDAETVPGLVIVRLDAPLYFANANYLTTQVRGLVEGQEVRAVIIDMGAVYEIDVSALASLRELDRDLCDRSITLHLADIKGPVRDVLGRTDFPAALGAARFTFTVHDAVLRLQDPCPRPCDPRVTQAWLAITS